MAENLNFDITGSKCFSNEPANCGTYGRLYDWATAMSNSASSAANPSGVQGICPSGWHLPSDAEWTALTNYVGTNAGTKLKATSGWYSIYSIGNNGTDTYGFSALPGGFGTSSGIFDNVGNGGYWWSATESNASGAYYRAMGYSGATVSRGYDFMSYLYSIRCLQD